MLLDHFQKITRTLPDCILVIDTQGTILSGNTAALTTLKTDSKTLYGKKLHDLALEQQDKAQQYINNWARSADPSPGVLKIRVNDGGELDCHIRGNLLQQKTADHPARILLRIQSKQEFASGFTSLNDKIKQMEREIVERKKAEEALQKLNEDLEDRVKQRTRELQTTNSSLENSIKVLKDTQKQLVQSEKMASLGGLVAGVAHEINTPIGVCVTTASYLTDRTNHYTRLYKEKALTRNDFEDYLGNASQCGEIIMSNLNRAANLIKSFKKVAVDQSSDEVREFNIKEYLQEILQSLTHELKSQSHEIKLECPDNLKLRTHPGAIYQIITNLIMNSIHHGFEDLKRGLIHITVFSDDGINISYRDNGIGLTQEVSSKIFEPFFTTKRNQGGSGLGMYIVYNLVTQTLGGEIQCQSTPNEGVNFMIQFPRIIESDTLLEEAVKFSM